MQIYLPVAEISVNMMLLLSLSGGVGFLSGLFGVGGGFLMTPLLIFIGVPPPVAVATEANQVAGSAFSASLVHARRSHIDYKMGGLLLIGGMIGSGFGVWFYGVLRAFGHLDLFIFLSYVFMLGIIGGLMLTESLLALFRRRRSGTTSDHVRMPKMLRGLPFKTRFRTSRLYISALLPIGLGAIVGVLAALMGVGGGFIMVPAMIYLLGMPAAVVVGTSLFHIIFVTANVTFLQAASHQTVDILLAAILLAGGVIGAQIGSRMVGRLRADQMRLMLAFLVLTVAAGLIWTLTTPPEQPFDVILYAAGDP